MNYQRIHDNIIEGAKGRIWASGMGLNRHHIVPKCVGGRDNKENIAILTPREHFIIHLLLVKIYNNHYSLLYAVTRLSYNRRYNSKKHSWLVSQFSNEQSRRRKITKTSEETRKKQSESLKRTLKERPPIGRFGKDNSFYGKKHSEETLALLSEIGRNMSAETREKIGSSRRGKRMEDSVKKKISDAMRGKKKSEEIKNKMRISQQARAERQRIEKSKCEIKKSPGDSRKVGFASSQILTPTL